MLWHDGVWEGFLTEFLVSHERRTAVAVSCNINEGKARIMAKYAHEPVDLSRAKSTGCDT
jgi:hypothetical protein